MPKKMMMNDTGCSMHKGWGIKMLILGLLILANEYWKVMGWLYFIGLIIALKGLLIMIMHQKK